MSGKTTSLEPFASATKQPELQDRLRQRQDLHGSLAAESEKLPQFHRQKKHETGALIRQVEQIKGAIELAEGGGVAPSPEYIASLSARLNEISEKEGDRGVADLEDQLETLLACGSEGVTIKRLDPREGRGREPEVQTQHRELQQSGEDQQEELEAAKAQVRELQQTAKEQQDELEVVQARNRELEHRQTQAQVSMTEVRGLLEVALVQHDQVRADLEEASPARDGLKHPLPQDDNIAAHPNSNKLPRLSTGSLPQHPAHGASIPQEPSRALPVENDGAQDDDVEVITPDADADEVHMDTVLFELCFYRPADQSRQPLTELSDAVRAALADKLEPFADPRFFKSLCSAVQKEAKCALTRARKMANSYPQSLETCQFCREKGMPCIIVEKGRRPTLVPVPEAMRGGLEEEDAGYWVPEASRVGLR